MVPSSRKLHCHFSEDAGTGAPSVVRTVADNLTALLPGTGCWVAVTISGWLLTHTRIVIGAPSIVTLSVALRSLPPRYGRL